MRPGPAYTPAWPHWFRTPYAVFAALTLIGLAPVAASAQTMALDAIFEEANDLKDGDACDAAVPLYDEVVLRADARSQLRGWALYNRGICQEQLGDEAGAREAYDTLVAEGPADLRRDARFRLGLVQILSGGDAAVAREILGAVGPDAAPHVLDMTPTTIEGLAGALGLARACVSNDSGAMHVAAAIGTPLVALFGPTDERLTSPLTRAGARAEVLTHPVWCRPCRFRECPIGHGCMTGITPERVFTSVDAMMGRRDAVSAGA